jgi:uncharacterized protein (TIGR02271 family)
MDSQENDLVVPVVNEELHADAIPVQTGGVRVTKRVESHDEVLEQELRKGRVEVKRVKTDRVVDGPQPVQRVGNTLVVPVVSEVLHVEKQWVVTEEIHLTQIEERDTVQETVRVNQEKAEVERLDEAGNVVSTVDPDIERQTLASRGAPGNLGPSERCQCTSRRITPPQAKSGVQLSEYIEEPTRRSQ